MNMFSDFFSGRDQREAATRRAKLNRPKKPFDWFKFFHTGIFVFVGVIFFVAFIHGALQMSSSGALNHRSILRTIMITALVLLSFLTTFALAVIILVLVCCAQILTQSPR